MVFVVFRDVATAWGGKKRAKRAGMESSQKNAEILSAEQLSQKRNRQFLNRKV